jgi:hypothetical protein
MLSGLDSGVKGFGKLKADGTGSKTYTTLKEY